MIGYELSQTDSIDVKTYTYLDTVSVETGTTTSYVINDSSKNAPVTFWGDITDDGYVAGLRTPTRKGNREIAVGLSDTHISESYNWGNGTYTLASRINFAEWKTGAEFSYTVTWDGVSTTNYTYVSIDITLAASILFAKSLGKSPNRQPNYSYSWR